MTKEGALEARLREVEARLRALEDTEEIKKLTRIYGYYLDKALWDDVLALFTDDCEIEISFLGVYRGKAQAEKLFKRILGEGPAKSGPVGLEYGRLFNHMIQQGVVHVAPDGRNASGRWRCFLQTGEFGKSAWWGEGPYEIRYRKDGDLQRWKMSSLHYYRTFHVPFEEGWAKSRSLKSSGINRDFPPDLPPTEDYEPHPGVYVPPFHYKNPISGR